MTLTSAEVQRNLDKFGPHIALSVLNNSTRSHGMRLRISTTSPYPTLFKEARYKPDTIRVERQVLGGQWEIDFSFSTSGAYQAVIDKANG